MKINIGTRHYQEVNEEIRNTLLTQDSVNLIDVYGQRYIGAGLDKGKKIYINGTPGNDLGIYLDGGEIEVMGNGQDGVGNTMSGGKIIVHGSVGDAMGYSMRDGEIYVKGDCGFRGGIHMKEYKEQLPIIVIGGVAGAYLGEYMAGGRIIVLNLENKIASNKDYLATGMHGGIVFIRGRVDESTLSPNARVEDCLIQDIKEIYRYVGEFTRHFGGDCDIIMKEKFTKIVPVSNRPFKDVYTNR